MIFAASCCLLYSSAASKTLHLHRLIDNQVLMGKESFIKRLSPVIFWDIDKEQFDPDLYPSHIILRVLEYGTLEDWRLVKAFYGMDKIVDVCKKARTLDAVSLAFVCAMSGTQKEDYRCYRIRQSSPTLWNS